MAGQWGVILCSIMTGLLPAAVVAPRDLQSDLVADVKYDVINMREGNMLYSIVCHGCIGIFMTYFFCLLI